MLCRSVALSGLANIEKALKGAEMAEIRIEQSGLSTADIEKLFGSHKNLIATCRPQFMTDKQRLNMLKTAIKSGAKWVDAEIDSPNEWIIELLEYAKTKDCKTIVSYHNNNKTPNTKTLIDIVNKAEKYKPQLIKIACKVNTIADNCKLLSLYNCNLPLLAIGMGELGKITRVVALKLGAPFTFVKGDNIPETAMGQLSESELKIILKYL